MIEIIPITLKEEDYKQIMNNKEIEENICFVSSISLITTLMNNTTFPIKNKYIAMRNILKFMNHVDSILRIKNNDTIVPIHTDSLIKYFTRDQYKEYVELLNKLEIMTKVPYKDGKFYDYYNKNKDENASDKLIRTLQYRIHNKYLNDELCMIIFDDNTDIELEKDNKYNIKLENTILKTKINYREAIVDEIQWYHHNVNVNNKLEMINKLRIRISNVLQLGIKRYIKKGTKVDRIYNSFCNLSKVSRKHLHVKGYKFNYIDVKNCQPLILCYYILSKGGIIDDNYLLACENGSFYETLFIEEQIKDMNPEQIKEYRDEIKVDTYQNIYFAFNKQSDITKRFANLYPNIYYFLSEYYSANVEETMASNLQNMEASIFNNILPSKSKNYYTLFDAIYFIDIDDTQDIYNQINTLFAKLNIKPALKLN